MQAETAQFKGLTPNSSQGGSVLLLLVLLLLSLLLLVPEAENANNAKELGRHNLHLGSFDAA